MSPLRRRAHQLPAGRNGLSRAYVAQNQRGRILRGTIDVASMAGYAAMSVEDIVVVAGVSRRTFYDYFLSKEDAFVQAYEQIVDGVVGAVLAAYDPNDPLDVRADRCIAAGLEHLARHPSHAEVYVAASCAAGFNVLQRRDAAFQALATLIDTATADLPNVRPAPAITSYLFVGGAHEIVRHRVLAGELDTLADAVPDLVHALAVPYVDREGADAARRASRRRQRLAA